MKLNENHHTFLSAAICGLLVWWFSEKITQNKEPWDGNLFIYLLALLSVGFFSTYMFKGSPKWAYWGGYIGQALFGGILFFGCIVSAYFFDYVCSGGVNFFPLGAVFLLIYSVPIFIGGIFAAKIQKNSRK